MGGQEPRARLGLLALGHIFKDYHPSAIRHRLLGKRDDPTFWQWTFGVGSDAAGQSRLILSNHLSHRPIRMIAAGGAQLDHLLHSDAR